MKVVENKTIRKEVLRLLRKRKRRPSWSVTRLTCCPRKTFWEFSGFEWKPEDEEQTQLVFSRGRAHHDILEVFPDKEKRLVKDGIVGHYDMRGRRIVEIFTTNLSLNRVKDPSKVVEVFPMKVRQLMAYLYMEGETEGDLLVFYLMGDYSKPIKPELKCYTCYFTYEELEENWKFLLGRKRLIEECLKKGEPPIERGFEWECKNCGYLYKCKEWLGKAYEDALEKLIKALGEKYGIENL